MQDYQYKEKLFCEWFEKQTKLYEHQRDKKSCDVEIVIKNNAFIRTFNNCYKKYMRHYETRNDCFCDCIMLVWEGMNAFDIKDNSSWENIATGKDIKNKGKLITFLKSHVVYEMDRNLYPKVSTTKMIDTPEGKKQILIRYNIEPESLNRLSTWKGEKEKVELINIAKESFWNQHEEYKYSMFVEWARQNMKRILSKAQIEFLKTLQDANFSKLDDDYNSELIGIKKPAINQRLKRIYEKLAKKYKEEEKFLTGGFAIQTLNAELKMLSKITNIIYTDKLEPNRINVAVSKQIIRSMNNTHFSNLLYDRLEDRKLKTIIKIYLGCAVADGSDMQLFIDEVTIPSNIIYDVVELVENRIEELEITINEEMKLLDSMAKKVGCKLNHMQFNIDPNKKTYYLTMNSYGIAVPKYE